MYIVGTDGNDVLEGTSGDDVVEGGAGQDSIEVTSGNDTVDGGEGEDELYVSPDFGYGGEYVLTGSTLTFSTGSGSGTTTFTNIENFAFNDYFSDGFLTIDASAWGDNPNATEGVQLTLYTDFSTLIGSSLDDRFRIDGVGHDIWGGEGRDVVSPAGGSGNYTIVTESDWTSISGATVSADVTEVELISFSLYFDGGTYNVDASASAVSVYVPNTSGDDIIIGGSGDDYFWTLDYSSASFDYLSAGTDILTGNGGADEYSFRSAVRAIDGVTITDFAADDWIDLTWNDAAGSLVSTFIGSSAFSGSAGEFRYEHSGGQTLVQYDGDGDGFADGTLVLSNGEFDLVRFVGFTGENNLGIGTITEGTNAVDGFTGGAERDGIYGLGGNDALAGAEGDDSLYGGAGWDTLEGGEGNDYLDGGNGRDTASYATALEGVIVDLASSEVQDTVGAGLDMLVDMENLIGSTFDDTLGGSEVVNSIVGGLGNDVITGLGGSDALFGESGDDTLTGGNGWDQLNGGDGDDIMYGGNGGDGFQGGNGRDFIFGEAGTDRAWLGSGNDVAYGGADDDMLNGQAEDDTLHGGGGNDTLNGGGQDDQLIGGAGDDVLIGGWGRDTLNGGTGADTFVFDDGHSARGQDEPDHIADFSSEEGDTIDLSAIDAIKGGADDAFTFIANEAFSGVAGQLRFYVDGQNQTVIEGDVDGDGLADFSISLGGVLDLTAGDFVL
ncbi:hypothetical protein K3152_02890 [Qipengyuania sp. 1NDH17]|uniref:Calcium-binding protein n=1 Tax=Qipengyuania polymorpha TaxID=2867234 RepID=A0ABS7IVD3_9SPHN|nr:calcium-binding protein [Qipengyuania polymorpha]MBX7457183.1 hypothetical protein [Qipengyuania polymorpha]